MATTTSPLFVGRSEELRRLLGLLERAEHGRPAVGLVAGDAGVGKTRLVAELAVRAEERGARVLIGGCMEAGDVGLPYVPFVDALRDLGTGPGETDLAAPLVDAVPSLGLLLPGTGGERVAAPPAGDGFERVQLFDGMRSLLLRLSELAPLVLVVEDLHWADRSTRDLLAYLVRALRTGRVTIIATYRTDELHRRHPLRPFLAELVRVPELERVDLSPFGRGELAQHLEAITGERVPAAAVDRVLDRSEGNAFYAEELVAAGAVHAEIPLPETLADTLLRRVEAVSDLAQEILKLAAVAGRRVSHQLLAAAAAGRPEPELEQGLREAIAARVLVLDPATETFRFRHALLQEVVYGELLPGERIRLHAVYAGLLAGSGPAAELAWHCLASHDLHGALGALVRAAAEASAVAAPAEAYRHLIDAVELWDRVPEPAAAAGIDRVELLSRAAEAANTAGRFRHAVALARLTVAAIDADAEPLKAAVAFERLGHYLLDLYSRGVQGEVLASCRRAVELVPADPPTPLRARVAAGLARALVNLNRFEEAARWCDEAVTVARAAGSADDETNALVTLAALRLWHGDVDVARALLRDARDRAAAARSRFLQLRAQHNLGVLELDAGDLQASCAALDEGAELAERTGLALSGFGWDTRIIRCLAWYMVGDWNEAERLAESIEEHDPGSEPSAAPLFVEIGRGRDRAAVRLGRLAGFREDPWVGYLTGGCDADFARWEGDLDRARESVRAVLEALGADEEGRMLMALWPAALGIAAEGDRAERARIAGDDTALAEAEKVATALLDRARGALDAARAVGRQVGPEALAWLARAEAEWTRVKGPSDPDRWAASVEAFSYGYVYEQARSTWRLAEALLAAGRRDEGSAAAAEAHAAAVRLGAEPLRAAIEALGRRARLDLGDGPPAGDGAVAGLTPRELEVVRLVAAGMSNSRIAEALFISPKTASVHVSNIMAKLGVRTRTEAAATAHRLGLDRAKPG